MLTSGARHASSGAKDIRQRGVVPYSSSCLKPPNLFSTFQERPLRPPRTFTTSITRRRLGGADGIWTFGLPLSSWQSDFPITPLVERSYKRPPLGPTLRPGLPGRIILDRVPAER